MKKLFKQLSILPFLVMTIFIINSCSSDDDNKGGEPIINENGGDVYHLQIITIETGVSLENEEYQGTFNATPITLVRVEDDKLIFAIPPDAPFGNSDLVIINLNNTKIRYNVLEQVLSESPEMAMSGFISNLENFVQTQSESPDALEIQQSISSFTTVFENANPEQKAEMAKTYLANKDFMDSMFTGTAGRISHVQLLLFGEYSAAVVIACVSGAVAYNTPPGWHTPVLTITAIVAAHEARSTFYEIIEIEWNTVKAKVNSIFDRPEAPFIVNRLENENVISLSNDVESLLGFSLVGTKLDQGDSESSNSYIQTFFTYRSRVNTTKTKVNDIITWINNNIPFADFGLLALDTLDESAPETDIAVDANIMNNLSFNISHPNLQLVNAMVNNNGQLVVKVKIIGTYQNTPVISTLDYTYQDELSNFSGSFPIEVSAEEGDFSLSGNWNFVKMTMIDGDFDSFSLNETKTEYWDDCPSLISYISKLTGASVNFTESSFDINLQFYEKYFGAVNIDNCSYTETPEEGNFYWNINADYNNQSFEENSILHFPVIEGSISYINNEGEGATPLIGDHIKIINENKIECHLKFFDDEEQDGFSIIFELTR